jgi:hypothetical protein
MPKNQSIMSAERIEKALFLIRRQKVILDRELARLYGVETRVLNQAVRRKRNRLPDDFMFSLTREEIRNLSQIVTSSSIKHAPNVFAFTEEGVAMLSSGLNSERAISTLPFSVLVARFRSCGSAFRTQHFFLRPK